MLRDISSLVGHTAMLQFMAALVQPGYQVLDSAPPPVPGQRQQVLSWVRLECALYAANVVTGRWVSETWNARKALGATASASRQRHALRRMHAGLGDAHEQDLGEEDEEDSEEEGLDDGDADTSDEDEDGSSSALTAGLDDAGVAGVSGGSAGAGISGAVDSLVASLEAVTVSSPGTGSPAAPGSGPGHAAAPTTQRWAPPRRSRSSVMLESEADAAVAQLVEIAAMSSVHPNGEPPALYGWHG